MIEEELMLVGQRIAAIRKRRGWTQAELASRMNTDQQIISRHEKDTKGQLTLAKVIEYAVALEASPAELLGIGNITINADNCNPVNGGVGYNASTYHISNDGAVQQHALTHLQSAISELLHAKDLLIEQLRRENLRLEASYSSLNEAIRKED